jgi:hypothetical protein
MDKKAMTTGGRPLIWLVGLLVLAALACQTLSPEVSATVPAPPTAGQPGNNLPASPTATVAATESVPTPTLAAVQGQPTATPEPVPVDSESDYQVVFVEEDDVLNVRSGPGVQNRIVGSLVPGRTGVAITGAGQMIDGTLWVPVQVGNVRGWASSRFLSETVTGEAFCGDPQPLVMIDQLMTAVSGRDGEMLAELVAVERGLRLRRHWWNPGLRFEDDEVPSIFANSQSFDWGVADGSGLPITGSFSQVMLPLLDRNLLGATEVACNEILHGGTAGIIQLPPIYGGLNYYSLYRMPGSNEIELDWGSWVVGFEKWQGRYYLSFLVHYEWEI